MKLRINKKDNKKYNIKVIATIFVAITLIGIVGISIGRYAKGELKGSGVLLTSISSVEGTLNKGFKLVKNSTNSVFKFRENAKNVVKLQKENENLKREIIGLKEEIDNIQSLQALKKSLNFIDEKYKANLISAQVVSKNDGNWYKSFVIAAGKKNGVEKDSVIVGGNGLVGVVYEVSDNYSKAISLLDTKSSVSFQLLKDSKSKGVISQGVNESKNYKSEGLLEGYMFSNLYNVLPGDVVITSGLGLYPQSIPIGTVEKVIDDKNKGLKNVIVKPYVDFKNIDDVVVIKPRNMN